MSSSEAGLTPQAAEHASRGVSDTDLQAGFISKQVRAPVRQPQLQRSDTEPPAQLGPTTPPPAWLPLQTPLEMRAGQLDKLPQGSLGATER